MTKLLASQAPGLPPHIIAQQTMPMRLGSGTTATPIRPQSTNNTLQQQQQNNEPAVQIIGTKSAGGTFQPRVQNNTSFRPVHLGGGKVSSSMGNSSITASISSINAGGLAGQKKSLTTVLDRLNMSTTCSTTMSSQPVISPSKPLGNAGSILASSLVQQLQAPLANQQSIPTSVTGGSTLRAQLSRSPALSITATPISVAATMSSTLPGNIIVPSSLTISSSTAGGLSLPPGIQLPAGIQLTSGGGPAIQLGGAGPLLQFGLPGGVATAQVPPPGNPGGPAQAALEQLLFPSLNQVNIRSNHK